MEHTSRIQEIKNLLAQSGLSQAELARSIGSSPAVISQILKGDYKGDSEKIKVKALNFLKGYEESDKKEVWVETAHTKAARFVITKAIKNRRIGLIYGDSGVGKTQICKRLYGETGNGIFIEADAAITGRSLLFKLTTSLRVQGRRSLSDTLEVICQALKSSSRVIFIDEAEYLDAKTLELVRRVNDWTETPVILSGTHDLMRVLRKHRQLASRIRWAWEMKPLGKKDVFNYLNSCGTADEKCAELVHARTRGNFRDVESIASDACELCEGGKFSMEVINAALEVAFIFN